MRIKANVATKVNSEKGDLNPNGTTLHIIGELNTGEGASGMYICIPENSSIPVFMIAAKIEFTKEFKLVIISGALEDYLKEFKDIPIIKLYETKEV